MHQKDKALQRLASLGMPDAVSEDDTNNMKTSSNAALERIGQRLNKGRRSSKLFAGPRIGD